ncbi:hypothetical protein MesoLj113a_70880 [Mesorhizobium sp. 113-1-2]|uniref:helix-turn-helix domain-containing protein n=1 Tax=Phyllobacteriaceae TaxID=69277 RepID=UPI0008198E91|nr:MULTISPECIES: hypothetical protein [Phyllobacteriaceae]BAV50392.1 Transposase of insertion sequence ISRm10-1, orfA protein [Mesorhizobium loti]BBD36388.1 transposase [Aminobacter sp. SS-2016]BCG75930.1 hypothetical protein MesoLj113a_70880 [Mesorhizobium sp. 113-1-2]BCG97175.1 hypothetical protein MesoLj131a_60390 [Mesorhizobium sp. 131-2-1]BCH04247.1 hypothetical protein MesoLj131b_62460 [Mesorhizobium sp. 131-2-5]
MTATRAALAISACRGEAVARKQGQPSGSKLDPHERFILGLIEETPDITLAEIAERLASGHGVRVVPSTVWMFLDKRGVTFKTYARPSARGLFLMAAGLHQRIRRVG